MLTHSAAWLMIAAMATVAASRAAAQTPTGGQPAGPPPWESQLRERLPEFGHRNWIAIVDSAYPAQTSAGVETLLAGPDQLTAVQFVLTLLAAQQHVRPVVYLDAELDYVPVADAAGIDQYRADLAQALGRLPVKKLPHAEIIDKLDAAGAKFRVLVLKTNMALPYTSVFIELDCKYWSPEAEERLRAAMAASR